MSFLATPDLMTTAAADLAGIGSNLETAAAAASAPTSSIAAAGADEISSAVTALFNAQGQTFQVLEAQAAAFHQRFVDLLSGGAASYASAEAANVQQIINGPFLAETGRPLFGDGANGITTASGIGTDGGAGGWLWGNGGNGGGSTAVGVHGGAGGPAGLIGSGGQGGNGGFTTGTGTGGDGGPGGDAGWFGSGGMGGTGGSAFGTGDAGSGGHGGDGGLVLGAGGNGGNGGKSVSGGIGGDGGGGGDAHLGAGGSPGLGGPLNGQNGQPGHGWL